MSRLVCVAPNPAIDRIYDVGGLTAGAIHRPSRATMVAGGKGLNVARAAHHLGGDAVAVALLRGHAGRWIAERLDEAGVPFRAAWAPGETRTCISIHDPATDGLTEIYDSGEPVPADAWHELEGIVERELAAGAELMTVSGGIPPGVDDLAFRRLSLAARTAGARALVDVYGPGLVGVLAARPWLVKVNATEAAVVTGRAVADAADALEAARAIRRNGSEVVIVTLGRAGAVVVTADAAWRVGEAPAAGRYAVGSGDAFLAGFAVGLLEGASLLDAVRLGAGAGVANAQDPGQGELDPAAARSFAAAIQVEPR